MAILAIPACLAASQPTKALYEKGAAAFQRKDYFGAIDSFEDAYARDPKNANVCYGLASSFSALGQKYQALQFYQQCQALAPHSQVAENAQKGIDYLTGRSTAPSSFNRSPSQPTQSQPNAGSGMHRHRQPAPQLQVARLPDRTALEKSLNASNSSPIPAWQGLLPQNFGGGQSSPGGQTQLAYQPPQLPNLTPQLPTPAGAQPNMPFAMQRPGRRHGGMQQQSYGSPQQPYSPQQSYSPMHQPYGGGFPNRQFGNQQSGSTTGPFSMANQGQSMGFGGGQSGFGANQLGGGRHHHHQQPMQGGGFTPFYGGGYGGYGSNHVPVMVVREYAFPRSLNAQKKDEAPFMVELLAKQEKLVIDKPDAAKALQPESKPVEPSLNPFDPDGPKHSDNKRSDNPNVLNPLEPSP